MAKLTSINCTFLMRIIRFSFWVPPHGIQAFNTQYSHWFRGFVGHTCRGHSRLAFSLHFIISWQQDKFSELIGEYQWFTLDYFFLVRTSLLFAAEQLTAKQRKGSAWTTRIRPNATRRFTNPRRTKDEKFSMRVHLPNVLNESKRNTGMKSANYKCFVAAWPRRRRRFRRCSWKTSPWSYN